MAVARPAVLVFCGCLAVAACGTARPTSVDTGVGAQSAVTAAPSASPGGVIPWLHLSPHPQPTVSPSPPPGRVSDARPCQASDVSAHFDWSSGATGHEIHAVRFVNVSTTTCALKGYPAVTAAEPGLPAVTATDGGFFPTPGTANIARGRAAFTGLETESECAAWPGGGEGPPYRHFAITLPGGGLSRSPSTGSHPGST